MREPVKLVLVNRHTPTSQVIIRPPLPPFPPGSYDRVLPWAPPTSRDFLRADCWGVPIPGLPFVRGGSSEHPERFLTYLSYKYPVIWVQRALEAHRARGYTHWCVIWPNVRDDGGYAIREFVDQCLFAKQTMPYVQVGLNSKDFDPRDLTPAQWFARIDPVMDALIAARTVDEFAVWEWDLHNVPGKPTIEVFKHIGQKAHAAGCSFWLHFSTERTSWFRDGDARGRFGFYDDLGYDVDGLQYQADSRWTIQELQARLVDTLWQFGSQRWNHKLRAFELDASLEFTHDHPDEDDANLLSYLACCTIDNIRHTNARVWGYGNGARRSDGSPL